MLGAGNFGIVVCDPELPTNAIKLYYDMSDTQAIRLEAELQKAALTALAGIACVPKVHTVLAEQTHYLGNQYLNGIVMDRVPFPNEFSCAVHTLLGYDQHDIDTEWGRDMKRPVGPDNPTRGFHAGPAMLEAIWEDEGVDMTIEKLAFIMGKGTSALLDAGILPLDIEWIYGGNGLLYVIDFGLAEFRHVDKNAFLYGRSSQSLHANYYVPKPGMRGWTEFLRGFTLL